MTYSIVARDAETGEFGVAVQSHYFQVSPAVPWALAGVGAVATQSQVNISYGPLGLELLQAGYTAEQALKALTAGDPLALAKTVRELIQKRLPDQPVSEVSSMDLLVGRSLSGARFSMLLISIFAGLALALAAVGIYGVMAYLVAQRTREIGIRLALGAEPKDVLRVVMEQGAKLALAGVAIGIVAALGLTRLMSSLLYGVKPTDFLTYLSVTAVLVLVALAACFLPALRASHVDPMVALRHE